MRSSPRKPVSSPRPRRRSFSPSFDAQVERHLAQARLGSASAVGRGAGLVGAARAHHDHVRRQAGRIAAREVDQALVDAELAVERQRIALQPQLGLTARDDAPVDAPEQLELLGNEPQLRLRRVAQHRVAAEPDRARRRRGR